MEKIMEATPDKWWLFIFGSVFAVACFGALGAAGGFFTMAIAPPSYTLPLAPCATENPVGTKVGAATGYTYFFIFGDASEATILNACKNADIKKISTVEYFMHNHMFLWQSWTCRVSGE